MNKKQMQKWILVLAVMIFVCFIFYKADFFHAEDVNTLENETLGFSNEEDESEENENEYESNENESEEDTEELLELLDNETQDDELNLSVTSNDNNTEINNGNLECDINCNCENGNCEHNCKICEVRKLVVNLPEIDDITDDNYEELYKKVQDIYASYCKLSDNEKQNLDKLLNYGAGEKFKNLFNSFHGKITNVASVTNEAGKISFYNDIFTAWSVAENEKTAIVTLLKNENLEEYLGKEEPRYLAVKKGKNITLELADNVILSGQNGNGVICVEGGTFILNGGNGFVVNDYDPVGAILVQDGIFKLKSGNVIGKGDTSKPDLQKGVDISCSVQIKNGTVYIEGGEIKGNGVGTEGDDIVGLYVQGGDVNINGGYITGSSDSTLGGVGVYVKADNTVSTVNISGGKIEGIGSGTNTYGYGVRMRGNNNITANISGGIIIGKSDNKSGRGIYITTSVVANINGGTIVGYSRNDCGGGVDVYEKSSKAFIYGGVIIGSGNKESYGISSISDVEINGGIITGNGFEIGYGVRAVEGGKIIISGGDVTGKGRTNGCGVYVSSDESNESSAAIKGGVITGISPTSGCGVDVFNGGTADIYNGEIAGSGISSYGVNVSGSDSVVYINGGLIGENNTYRYVIYDDSNETIAVQKESVTYIDTELAYGVKVSENGKININAGKINGSGQIDGYGVYVSGNGAAVVTDGDIAGTGNSNNGYGIMVDGGTTDISGGVFTGEGASKDGYGMRVDGGRVYVGHGTSTPYGGMFIGNGSESGEGYGLYVKGGDVTLCTGVYKGSTRSVYTINPDKADSFTKLLEAAHAAHAYRYVNIPADEVNSTTEGNNIAIPDSIVIPDEWIYNDKLLESDFYKKPVTVMKIPLDIKKPTVEPDKVDYGYSDKEAPVICIEAERLIRDKSKEITYQWYDSKGAIAGATEEKYVPIGLSVGKHFFKCEVICDQYKRESEEVEINVNKKCITATVVIKDKEYDGTTKADIDNIILNGVVAGDDVYLAYEEYDKVEDYSKIEASFETADAGEDISVLVDKSKFKLSGADRDNYYLDINVETAKIKPRELKLTVSVNDKVYDGSDYAEIDKNKTSLIYDEIAKRDKITLDIKDIEGDEDYILRFKNGRVDVDEDIPVELNKDKFQLKNNTGNYSLIFPDDVTADITPVEVDLTVIVKDEEISANEMKKSNNSATIISADFDREKLADCDVDIVDLVDFSNINATFESVELGKHTIKFDSDFYLIDSNGERTDNYILIPNVTAAIYKKDASDPENPAPENPDPEDNNISTSIEEPVKINSILSNNPFTGINDHLLYFTVILVLFGGIILTIYFTGKRKKGKNNSKS